MTVQQKLPITAIVMTLNEERNLQACLQSIGNHVEQIVVLDSYSTDKTLEIAERFTDRIFQNKFVNYAKQYLWAIENIPIESEWILRIDADERWTEEGFAQLREIIEQDRADGVYVRMKIYFMDRWIRHGGFYPNDFLRVYKRTKGKLEDRWMDEHIQVDGRTLSSGIDVIESNYDRQRNLGLWTDKHNGYSTREAIEFLVQKHGLRGMESIANVTGNRTERKRWLKENLYFRMPLFLRPFLYFVYRYIFQLGFLDGKEGFIFHTLHAYWYRFLVDAKVYQIEKNAALEGSSIREAISGHYGIEV